METAHIYIYGDIGLWQGKDSSDWGEITLSNVKEQYEAQSSTESITLHIHSPGGYVTEGFAIHDYIRSLGKPVYSIIEGMCYSIATVIHLAGDPDKRKMTSNADFMIHNPWGYAGGDSEEVQKYADQLKKEEDRIANFYSSKTNLTQDQVKEMMKAETFMSAQDALKNGFITEIMTVMKAVAKFNFKSNEMSKPKTKKESESVLDKAFNTIKSLLTGAEESPQNKIVQDASGTEIDFTDLEDDETPEVGDKAVVDGNPASGEYTMPNGEVYVFDAGSLTEIKTSSEEGEQEEEESKAKLQKEVDQLKSDLKAEKEISKSLKAQNDKFEKTIKDQNKTLKQVQSDILNVKKAIGSEFQHEEGERKEEPKKTKNRQVWKSGK